MTQEPQNSDERPKIPQFKIPTQLYVFVAAIMAMWVGVTFFMRNPYQEAAQLDYSRSNSYTGTEVAGFLLLAIPVALVFYSWYKNKSVK